MSHFKDYGLPETREEITVWVLSVTGTKHDSLVDKYFDDYYNVKQDYCKLDKLLCALDCWLAHIKRNHSDLYQLQHTGNQHNEWCVSVAGVKIGLVDPEDWTVYV